MGRRRRQTEWPRASRQEPKLPGSSTWISVTCHPSWREWGTGAGWGSGQAVTHVPDEYWDRTREKEEVPLIQRLCSGCHRLCGLRQHTFIFSHPGAWKSEIGVPAGLGSWWGSSFWFADSQILTMWDWPFLSAGTLRERDRDRDRQTEGASSSYKPINPIGLGLYACDFM